MQSTRLIMYCFLLLTAQSLFASGIKGTITDTEGNPLAFATIFVKELGTGTSSNAQGKFSYRLESGSYTITFQYIGYETVVKQVNINKAFVELDIVLSAQTYELKTVEITSNGRDPAYIIMRKAIAKAPFHLNQLDSYRAQVYTKGSGRVRKSPFFVRKMMQKEGIDSTFSFVSESVSEVYYKRPNYFEEKVISVYTTGDAQDTSPNAYINASFYEPTVAEVISPLSPKAFAYYNFVYEGFFMDRGREIDKIRITPRSKGENVVEGTINIVDGEWSIHSLDIVTRKAVPANITINIKQIYAPIEDKAWLPVSHQFEGNIKFFGFHFDFGYLATVSDYEIEFNPDLDFKVAVIDEKLEQEEAATITNTKSEEIQDIENRLGNDKKVTRKELRKLMKEYEKTEQTQQEEPDVIAIQNYTVDSSAYKRDSIYWEKIRPVPLNELEVRGYTMMDSLNKAEEEEAAEIEVGGRKKKKKKGNAFSIGDILFGGSFGKTQYQRVYIKPFLNTLQFNTVDGYNFEYGLGYVKRDSLTDSRFFIEGTTRYGFARKKLNYWGTMGYDFGEQKTRGKIRLQAGTNVAQYNPNNPIHPLVNTFTTLILERNYMKLYEKTFAKINFEKKIKTNLEIAASLEWAERTTLRNYSTHHWFNPDSKMYSLNIPRNQETNANFDTHQATIASFEIKTRPWQKYRIRNGKKFPVDNSSPLLSAQIRQAFKVIGGSDTNFSHLDLGYQHQFRLGIRGTIDVKANVGFFLNQDDMYFPDYQHFLANLTPFVTTDPVGSFRLLDYYRHSTNDAYITAHAHYQFRKFLVTQIPQVQFLGIKENIFINYLGTQTSDNYFEAGYSIDNIFRVFRLELVSSFQDWKYQDFGVRIGIATSLDNLFD